MNIEPFLGALEASKVTVSKELTSFLDYVRAQLPNSVDSIGRQLASYYLGCNEVLRQAVLGRGLLAEKSSLLARLNIYQIHGIMSAYHSTEVISKAALTEDRRYEVIYMDGVESMYHKPPEYTHSWWEFFRENENGHHSHFAPRLMNRRYDEIAAIVGLRFNLSESIYWGEVSIDIARTSRVFYDAMVET